MKRIRSFISITLAISLLISSCLGYPPSAQAEEELRINSVFVERTDNEVLETAKGVIEIDGSGLKDKMVRVKTTAGGGSMILGTHLGRRVVNEDVFIKFELTGPEIKSILFTDGITVGDLSITVDDSNFPTINSVEPKVVYLGTGQLDIKGSNLDKANLSFGQGSFNGNIDTTDSQITISNISGDTGFHDIIFTREKTGVEHVSGKVIIRRLYQNQFRVVQERQFAGLEMYPNKGVPRQTTVYFRAPHLEESSVFFLRDINDPYYASNLGTDYHYQSNVNDDDIITVKVPDLVPGTYQVVLTNRLTDPPAGTDLRGLIVWQQVVGSFLVVSASNAAQIVRVEPDSGPNLNNNKVTVIGQNFDELLIDGLTLDNPDQSLSADDHKSLAIDYGTGKYNVGTGEKDVEVKRTIKVFIGDDTQFQPVDQQEFSSYYDNLRVFTPILNDQEIQDEPRKDVVVELTTTLAVLENGNKTGQEYRFVEQAILAKGYLFIKSYTAPSFTEVIPNSIPVMETGGQYETREDLVISITGQDFIVNKFTDPDTVTEHVYYPLVNLGGAITLKREGKNADDVLIKDASNSWKSYPGASMEVLHGTTVIDGTAGKEIGNRIVIRIPAGIQVSQDCFDATHLEITNPMKNSGDYGYPIRKEDMLRFILVDENQGPVINSVEPHVVPTEGEKGVQIKGANFQVGVRVFIDGLEVQNINRDPSSQLITFDAPPGREGETRLVVMNPNGEADSAQFIYVKTQTDPRITSISPAEGTIGTLVVINGDGFLGPDPTATTAGMGIYRLLGARVLFDNNDINEYRYKEGSSSVIEPQGYIATAGQELLRVEGNRLVLADYYPSILLWDDNNKQYYIINKNNAGQPFLTDGVQEWTFDRDGTDITARDKSGNIYDVNSEGDKLTLTRNSWSLVLDILTPYRVDSENNIIGHRAKVVDGGKRIMVTVPNLQVQRFYDVTVINPDTKRAAVPDGFYFYLSPQRIPQITSIIPDRGSTVGGYFIEINGTNFERTETIQTRVFIDGVEVPKADTIVSPDLKSIRVKVPPYKGDLAKELGVGFKAVPVVVLNPSDGGSSGLPEGFTYVVPTSQPFIDSLVPAEGTAAGGDYVQILGRDFRLYEPFQDVNNNFAFDSGEPFTDINGSGEWEDLRQWTNLEDMKNDVSAEDLEKYIQVLPRVYFGSNEAQVTDFSNNRLVVKTPASQPGTVSVYVVNNDYGVSNSKPFTFKGSSPRISAVIPDVGRRQGGEIVEIHGSGLQQGL
ncbi:MAG: IPT/TIG domain-containing protein, partial [Syntrophomonadaceae bacterium]